MGFLASSSSLESSRARSARTCVMEAAFSTGVSFLGASDLYFAMCASFSSPSSTLVDLCANAGPNMGVLACSLVVLRGLSASANGFVLTGEVGPLD
jgi:hypothetical protein